jgi:apolipoprotein N-acyltransferase
MTAFRPVENGFSAVRVTALDLSAACNNWGRPLGVMDYFKAEDKVLTAYSPEE